MAGLLALLAWTTTPASAANIVIQECKDGKAGCYLISIYGEIKDGDAKNFTDLVSKKSVTSAVVYLNSPGGVFEEGIAIARLVHQRNFDTYVGDGNKCMSMCAIIWLAGNIRYYTGKSTIGFHGIFTAFKDKQSNRIKGSKLLAYNAGNALVGAFYSQLGLSDKAIETLTNPAPDEAFYLNTKNIGELGINATRWGAPASSPTLG